MAFPWQACGARSQNALRMCGCCCQELFVVESTFSEQLGMMCCCKAGNGLLMSTLSWHRLQVPLMCVSGIVPALIILSRRWQVVRSQSPCLSGLLFFNRASAQRLSSNIASLHLY